MCPLRLRSGGLVPSNGEKGLKRWDEEGVHPQNGMGGGLSSCMSCAVDTGHVLENDLSHTFS